MPRCFFLGRFSSLRCGRSVPKLRRSLSSLVGGNGPSFVPPQAPRSVRMRALRRLDESHRPCAWISSTNVLVSSEGCLLVDHTSKGLLSLLATTHNSSVYRTLCDRSDM
ncbi:uncharacterized protein LOC134184607 isoform X2 [Corticium candelabrum]|uniref:uncharacterized protein LOC134184607 isoform X2 n=1 Tax=Corticium candelabrum TaxID=121492 RepID=UPI002E34B182|nr:uncharacterized protein LOC134184607 isoform X2 [Corticium candelabrum]